ncbi:hypothetical protein HQ590_09815 [bacterium]|nr:hypothetical protein [bacterium]
MRLATVLVGLVAGGWFFVTWGGAADEPPSLAECRLALEALRRQQVVERQGRAQGEETIRVLTENLAIARTESELFQKQWAEARLRAEAVGVNFAEANTTQLQRQLIESVRALYLLDAERTRLLEQLQRLAVADGTTLVAEQERARQLVTASTEPAAVAGEAPGRLTAARILEVNPQLRVVVLNIGALQGARVGMPFVVRRGAQVVGEVRVVEVRPRICGALIERTEPGLTLQTGDTAAVTSG